MPLDPRVARRLKLRDLHILLEVVNAGSMGKAADRLHVSQPVVSKAIASLERTLGARLLDRNMRGISLTDYGRAALKCGVAVFDDLKKGIEEIEFIADPTVGVVRVGCAEPEFASVVSAIINRLSPRYPRIVFQLIRVDQAAPFRDLETRDVDFVIAEPVFREDQEDHMAAEILYADSAVVAVGSQSPWARRRRVDLVELVDEPWLLSAPGSYISSIVVDAFRARGLSPPQPVVVASSHMRTALLANGRFVTALASAMLQIGWLRGSIKALPVTLPGQYRDVAIVTLKGRSLSPVAQLFIECAREVAKPLVLGQKRSGGGKSGSMPAHGTNTKSTV
jgi:DNA-binding transcriptional LysR family regulator